MPAQTFKLLGQVINQKTREGLSSICVEAWDRDHTNNDLLGQALTNAEGSFVIEFDEAKFKDGGRDALPDLFFKIFAGKREIYNSRTRPIKDWASSPQPLMIEVDPASPPAESAETATYVEGEVVRPDGTPLARYPVRALDRAICDWRSLGETRTDEKGRYRIDYDPAKLAEWGKTRADLKVQVYDPQLYDPPGVETIVATSPLILQSRLQEVVNFSIGQGSYRGPDEFTRVHKALAPLLQPVDDPDCLEVVDVLILARESKLPKSSVAYYIKSRRWAKDLDVRAAVFYGLLRQGEPARLDSLFARPFSQLWKTLESAVERNVIDLALDDALRSRLIEVQQNHLGSPDHPFRRLLQTTALSAEQRNLFALRLAAGELTGDEFWDSLETNDGFGAEPIAELKAMLELQSFTGDNTSLSIRLRSGLNLRQPSEVAAFSVEDWRDVVLAADGVEIPDETLPERPDAERKAAYAQMLYRSAERRYPTRALAAQMGRDQSWASHPLSSFLAAYPDFEFAGQRISFFLRQRAEAVNMFPDPNTGRRELLRLEQMFHLTPAEDKLAAIQPLWDAGLRSARQIVMAGRQQLLRKVGNSLAKSTVNGIYHRAAHNTGVALNVYLKYHQGSNSGSLYAMRAAPGLPDGREIPGEIKEWWDKLLPGFDSDLSEWSELFGSPDACECSHCQSAFGPGAYLVDMLYFLQRATDDTGKTALDYLLERRPDLGTLQLTCENAETLMPQIDLVIEIMEQIVAHSANGESIPAGSIGQTTWDSERLAAAPEHMDPAAYEKLRKEDFPFNRLPFDLWLEEGRRYLKQMGVARHELMRVMPPKTGVGALQIAGETLGMSPLELAITMTPSKTSASLALRWGIDAGDETLEKRLGLVKALMKQARIDYDTLTKLLNTRYVNPGWLISVAFAGESCSLDGARFAGPNGAGVVKDFDSFLDRLHRFLRLQQRLGWTEYELDGAIKALGAVNFNLGNIMVKLADMERLREALDLPVGELCVWCGNLDTHRFEDDLLSQYEEKFLDPAIYPDTHTGAGPDLRNQVFALRPDRRDLAVTTSTTLSRWLAESDGATAPLYSLRQDYAAYIQSATRLTAEDIMLLAREVLRKDAATGNAPLDLVNVSLLYRIGSFTRALDLSVQEYLYLVRLLGRSPLTAAEGAASPSDTMAVYELLYEIDRSDWPLDKLVYLLLDDDASAVTYGPAPEAMDAVLNELSHGFAGIGAIDAAKANPELLTSLSQSLGASLQLDAVVLEELLFTHRVTLGDQLLGGLIAAAGEGFPAPAIPFHDVYETLHKFALAWNGMGLDPDHLAFVVNQDMGWTDIAALPLTPQSEADFEGWRRLIQAADLQRSVFSAEQSLFGLLAAAKTAATRQDLLAQASQWIGWSLEDLTYLAGPEGFDYLYPDAFLDERWLVAVEKALAMSRPLGVSAARAHAWTAAELTFTESESIKQALALAYDRDRWLEVITTIQDELRVLKRDALLGYLLNNLSSDDPYDVYRYYLIDPEMAPCARASRIVEAHAAVQLFAQRIMLNLETPLSFPREDAEAWQWRKNYRIWEAARKVFLYPENWIEPELRDNKSIFFKELEDGLLQNEVTFETAERLYREYLTKLDQVSRLEIMGMYEDEETGVLHVFGRTRDVPAIYYYRRWEEKARWTPWERVDLDIQADHLIPIVYNGRLYLFWPDFKVTEIPQEETAPEPGAEEPREELERELEDLRRRRDDVDADLRDDHGVTVFTRAQMELIVSPNFKGSDEKKRLAQDWLNLTDQIQEKDKELKTLESSEDEETPVYKFEIELGMSWSQYQSGGWSPKTLGKQKLIGKADNDSPKDYYFTGWVSDGGRMYLAAHTIRNKLVNPSEKEPTYLGYFYFNDCGTELYISEQDPSHPSGVIYVTTSDQQYHHWSFYWSQTSFSIEIDRGDQIISRSVLKTVPAGYANVYYAHQYGLGGNETSPFFYSDDRRSYFVRLEYIPEILVSPSSSGFAGGVQTARTVLSNSTSLRVRLAGNHYGGISGEIILRSDSQPHTTFSARQTAFLADLLADRRERKSAAPIDAIADKQLGQPRYLFTRFYHPYTCLFLKQLSRYGIEGLLNPDPEWGEDSENLHRQLMPLEGFDFESNYQPDYWVADDYPVDEIDFDHDSSYGSYNWELFFHIPLLIATRLMQNQRFSEARRWFNYIFDPTHTDGRAPARFWKIRPFYEEQLKGPAETLQALMDLLEHGDRQFEQRVDEWAADPFNPHAVARLRTAAYMKTTVMKYLDCMIAEADQLFTMDTRETITEAAQLYLLAADILGERPTLLPARESETLTANLLLGRIEFNWSHWNPLDLLDSLLPNSLPGRGFSRTRQGMLPAVSVNAQGAGSSYDTLTSFCIPHNEKLYGYWDTVADRLFKIRHCMNIAGVVRSLPLFTPPVDPALLVRAAAVGLDLGAVLSSLYEPLPKYRFNFMLQKAMELCGEARGLGGELLSALEKKDAEGMSLLRSAHEVSLLRAIRELKRKSAQEARHNLEALGHSKESAEFRRGYYGQKQLMNLEEIAGIGLIGASAVFQAIGQLTTQTALPFYPVPKFITGMAGTGPVSLFVTSDWEQMTEPQKTSGGAFMMLASLLNTTGSISQTIGGYKQRKSDWNFQAELAKREIEQLDKQILAAEIRLQIAEADLENHEKQIAQAEEAEAFMKTKFTNQELYSWTVSKLSALYFQTYQMAYRLAQQAQKCFRHELGPGEKDSSFITGYYWDSLKKGLLAGEQLNYDLRRMENAYLEANQRELEMTKHISLMQFDPVALVKLRETGSCEIFIPEVLFDMDFPGHYFRRIKVVRVTVPCVAGPYANVSATLRLTESWIRPVASTSAPLEPAPGLPQTSIATSTANQDGGVFELNFSDSRYLPFEGAGVISHWKLDLPTALRSFDYDTISDVVIHMSYTAREAQDGGTFKNDVNENLVSSLNDIKQAINKSGAALARLFSLRREFAADWNRLLFPTTGEGQQITLKLGKPYFPKYLDYLWEKNDDGGMQPYPITLEIASIKVYLDPKNVMPTNAYNLRINGKSPEIASDISGLLCFDFSGLPAIEIRNESETDWSLSVSGNPLLPEEWKDLYILLDYKIR